MKYVIFTDIDGTVYGKDYTPSVETVRDIKIAQKAGVEVVLSTGNGPFEVITNLAKLLNIRYIICSNGANMRDLKTGEWLINNKIYDDQAKELVALALKNNYMSNAWSESELYSNGNAELKTLMKNVMWGNNDIKHIDKIQGSLSKLEFYNEKSITDKIWKEIEHLDLQKVRMNPMHIELTHYEVSKGIAVKHFCNLFGVDINNTMSIGDSPNDHSMLAITGYSYAMGNSRTDETKKIAKYETDDVDKNGLGKAIVNFLEIHDLI